jgi:hypothetical protein
MEAFYQLPGKPNDKGVDDEKEEPEGKNSDR